MDKGLKKVLYFLGTLDDQDIDWMVRNGFRKSIPAKTQIIEAGQPTDWLFFILAGEFSVLSSTRSEIARLGSGEILGEISFVDSRPPSATVAAAVDSVVGAVPVEALERKMSRDVGFAARFYKAIAVALADRLRHSAAAGVRSSGAPSDADDIDVAPHLLDSISIAGTRFADMQRRPWGADAAAAQMDAPVKRRAEL
jgi:CRP/FNR family cyclic AMP-dependent transcriptional regulator